MMGERATLCTELGQKYTSCSVGVIYVDMCHSVEFVSLFVCY